MEGNLKENGWFLSTEGIAECKKACVKENPTTSEWLKAAANLDLKLYGTKFLPEDINKGKLDSINGPGVLQIQKLRNISAPRANEESGHAPRLLKFQLTDGPGSCQGMEFETISDLSLSTPPGTKICLVGSVPIRNGMLLLDDKNTKVLGGEVESLVTKWKLNKSLAKHSRNTTSTEGGPPSFVPLSQAKPQENRGKGNTDNSKGSSSVSNGHDSQEHSDSQRKQEHNDSQRKQEHSDSQRKQEHSDSQRKQEHSDSQRKQEHSDSQRKQEPNKYKQTQDNVVRKGRDRDQDRDDRERGKPRDSFKGEPRRNNQDRPYGKGDRDGRPYQRDNRGRGGNRNHETSQGYNSGDRNNPRRTDHNRSERIERHSQNPGTDSRSDSPVSRSGSRSSSGIRENGTNDASSRDEDSVGRSVDGHGRGGSAGRGSSRGGRGGRREPLGRGRSNSGEQDESEDYRARQPSDKGTLWDFVKLTIKTPPKTSTPPPTVKETKDDEDNIETQPSTNHTTQENQTSTTESTTEDEPVTKPQEEPAEHTDKRTKPETKPTNQAGREQKPPARNNDHRSRDYEKSSRNEYSGPNRDRDGRQRPYQQRQQQSSGQGRGRGPRGRHDDGRSYNQSLPPRLQKKQQQYHQQHFMSEKESRDKSSSPGSGSSGEGRLSQSPSVESGHSSHSKSSEDMTHRQQQLRRQKNYPRQQRQQSETKPEQNIGGQQGQYEQSPPIQTSYLATQPQGAQHSHYHVEQHPMYEQHAEGAPIIQQEYNYQQQPPPPPSQQYPVYPMQTQMGPPQAVMVTQPITSPSQQHIQTPITTAQIRWKKGNQCLALRRDGQYYSAKIEHVTADGQCMVSFQDFHGGCEMTSISSLRPFPIIAWTEPNAQSLPATTMTPVPVYAQPTQVTMVPRPQVMVPLQAQPSFPMGPKGPVPGQATLPPQGLPQPPPGMQWQPAHVGYHEIRPQPYQTMMHYDPMAQASTPAVRQAYYPMPPAGTVQFVRGLKELHGQELYPYGSMSETNDANKGPPTSAVYYNVKSKKTNTRPPQAMYIPPRPQSYGEPNN